LLLFSCKEVTFKEPQPAGVAALTEVPSGLRGAYQAFDQTTGDFSDTLIIEPWGYRMKDKDDKDWLGRGTLSDTLVVKYHENYYFVNFKSGGQWVLRLVKQGPDGSIGFLAIDIQDDAKRKDILKKISKKLKVSEFKHKDDTESCLLHPFLELAELDLELTQFLFVLLPPHLRFSWDDGTLPLLHKPPRAAWSQPPIPPLHGWDPTNPSRERVCLAII